MPPRGVSFTTDFTTSPPSFAPLTTCRHQSNHALCMYACPLDLPRVRYNYSLLIQWRVSRSVKAFFSLPTAHHGSVIIIESAYRMCPAYLSVLASYYFNPFGPLKADCEGAPPPDSGSIMTAYQLVRNVLRLDDLELTEPEPQWSSRMHCTVFPRL